MPGIRLPQGQCSGEVQEGGYLCPAPGENLASFLEGFVSNAV